MGEHSKIAWTHHTFNPWVGCQRVSPGCEHCYAEAYDKRVGGATQADGSKSLRWGPKAPRVVTSDANWRKPLAWDKAAAKAGERHRVFCASLADVFEDRFDLEGARLRLFDLIRRTPNIDWLLLTKRPQNISRMISAAIDRTVTTPWDTFSVGWWLQAWSDGRPPENVWLGTTVEDQRRAEERVPHLVAMPATVRFLSCEPLLERVDLSKWMRWVFSDGVAPNADGTGGGRGVDWVIMGGESGPGARPFAVDWARDLVRQCRAAGAAPFVKQLGSRPVYGSTDDVPGELVRELDANGYEPSQIEAAAKTGRLRPRHPTGADPSEWPLELRVREFPR